MPKDYSLDVTPANQQRRPRNAMSDALYGLIGKYYPAMTAGKEYRPITDQELKRTSVYAIQIESWSGKRNWPDEAEQSDE